MDPFRKTVRYHGIMVALVCDGKCSKAWGINGRPRVKLSELDDDYVLLPDSALGTAPKTTVIVSEGGDLKPSPTGIDAASQMNRWCARECERCEIYDFGLPIPQRARDLENPRPNIPTSKAPFARDEQGRVNLTVPSEVLVRVDGPWKSATLPAGVPIVIDDE